MDIIHATTKPLEVTAIIWTGHNPGDVSLFLEDNGYVKGTYVDIGTEQGLRVASIGDYIVRTAKGGFYPCKPDIFKATYDF